ncbi:MAG: alpha/beta hydrolase [Betaproteobacteria bacterium]|nr:alpha/beta hydrolase [Betaproteobacteria bacterium]
MNAERVLIDGPAGKLEAAINDPGEHRRAIALVAHPHPLHGGTLDNKVVQTLAKAMVARGCVALRPNFRGVGASEGVYDEGGGEALDLRATLDYARARYGNLPLVLAGFSFGAFVQSKIAAELDPKWLVLVGPAVGRFEVSHVPAGTLVIHGELDDVVPLKDVFEWARPQQLPVVVFPGVGHFFHGALAELQRVVASAFPCSG